MDPIKDAFDKVKKEIASLYSEVNELKLLINELKISKTPDPNTPTPASQSPSSDSEIPTLQHITSNKTPLHAFKSPYTNTSIGNEGVPTLQPTNQPTNQHSNTSYGNPQNTSIFTDKISHLERASEILSSLDSLKKEIRSKFKKLTPQEMAVFSAIYQFEEQGFPVDYALISSKLSISDISVRDYVRKLILKGIPIQKSRLDNKKILLFISESLKRVVSLSTILELREL